MGRQCVGLSVHDTVITNSEFARTTLRNAGRNRRNASGLESSERGTGYQVRFSYDEGVTTLLIRTEDAVYRSSPFRAPFTGRERIRRYWQEATSTQAGVQVRFGEPIQAGDKIAVEWWTTMRGDGSDLTLPGCLILRFAEDGRCRELREYWHLEEGLVEPAPGWGE